MTYELGAPFNYEGAVDVFGCTDDTACNYNPEATLEDQSCEYAEENFKKI